jgi:DNA-binding transcriptional LysR family regulator
LSLEEGCNGLLDADETLAGACTAVRKVYPARIESIDHLYAGGGMLHALAPKDRFPAIARHRLGTHRCPQRFGECCGQSIRRNALRVLPLRIKARLLVSDSGTLLGACQAGAGIAQVLEIGCGELLRGGELVELLPEWSDERFPLYAVYPSRLHRAAKVRAFVEFCLEIMGGNQNAVSRKAR